MRSICYNADSVGGWAGNCTGKVRHTERILWYKNSSLKGTRLPSSASGGPLNVPSGYRSAKVCRDSFSISVGLSSSTILGNMGFCAIGIDGAYSIGPPHVCAAHPTPNATSQWYQCSLVYICKGDIARLRAGWASPSASPPQPVVGMAPGGPRSEEIVLVHKGHTISGRGPRGRPGW